MRNGEVSIHFVFRTVVQRIWVKEGKVVASSHWTEDQDIPGISYFASYRDGINIEVIHVHRADTSDFSLQTKGLSFVDGNIGPGLPRFATITVQTPEFMFRGSSPYRLVVSNHEITQHENWNGIVHKFRLNDDGETYDRTDDPPQEWTYGKLRS